MLISLICQKKQIKMFEHFREKITNNGILFLQETHSSHETAINWRGGFKGELFFFAWNHKVPWSRIK